MMQAKRLLPAAVLMIALLTFDVPLAESVPIPGLCNTGQPVGCVGVLGDSVTDPNYTITAGPAGFTGSTKTVIADGNPIPPWVANDSDSRWIGPGTADADSVGPVGNYTYRTTFSLAGFNPATASISGAWAIDDQGVDILLNGVSLGLSTLSPQFSLTPFSITSGFVSGVNTLDFVVFNGLGNTGLRIDNLVTNVSPISAGVPEPSTLVLLGIGLVGVAGRTFLRRTRV